MPSPKSENNKRELPIDDDDPTPSKKQKTSESIDSLQILPRDEWKTDSNYRLICKVSGCTTRGRGDRDDMCKRHYSMFREVGRSTGGESGRGKKKGGRQKKEKVEHVDV